MKHELNQIDFINYIQTEFEPGTREYGKIVLMYAGLFNDNEIEGYAMLAHGLIRHAALYEINEVEKRG